MLAWYWVMKARLGPKSTTVERGEGRDGRGRTQDVAGSDRLSSTVGNLEGREYCSLGTGIRTRPWIEKRKKYRSEGNDLCIIQLEFDDQ
jgi:hypothetical protein